MFIVLLINAALWNAQDCWLFHCKFGILKMSSKNFLSTQNRNERATLLIHDRYLVNTFSLKLNLNLLQKGKKV